MTRSRLLSWTFVGLLPLALAGCDYGVKVADGDMDLRVPGQRIKIDKEGVEIDQGVQKLSVKKGNVEIMLQTRKSIQDDIPKVAEERFRALLFIEVPDLAEVEAKLEGADFVFTRRETFYGSKEVCVWAPDGSAVTFAQFG